MLSARFLLGLFVFACASGGQSFDDGRDGVETKPSMETDGDGTDDSVEETELDDSADTDNATATDNATDNATDTEGDTMTSTDASEGGSEMDEPETVTDEPETVTGDEPEPAMSPRVVEDTTACLAAGDGGALEVQVSHECLCPNMLRCALAVDEGRVVVDAWVEQLDLPCPPACFFDTATCSVEFDQAVGSLEYGTDQVEFTVDALSSSEQPAAAVCLSVGNGPGPSAEPAAELCKYVDLLEAGEAVELPTVVDLSAGVELSTIETAAGCECCNWQWGWYYIPCGDDGEGIVLTTTETPYGTLIAEPTPEMDDGFSSQEVTLGCQGNECTPSCLPEEASGLGVATGELRLLEDGYVSTNGEDFFARAEFRISAVR